MKCVGELPHVLTVGGAEGAGDGYVHPAPEAHGLHVGRHLGAEGVGHGHGVGHRGLEVPGHVGDAHPRHHLHPPVVHLQRGRHRAAQVGQTLQIPILQKYFSLQVSKE